MSYLIGCEVWEDFCLFFYEIRNFKVELLKTSSGGNEVLEILWEMKKKMRTFGSCTKSQYRMAIILGTAKMSLERHLPFSSCYHPSAVLC